MESQENKYPLFWIISQEARVKLCQFQFDCYQTKLAIANSKAPWEEKPPVPKIPVQVDENDIKMMELPPMSNG